MRRSSPCQVLQQLPAGHAWCWTSKHPRTSKVVTSHAVSNQPQLQGNVSHSVAQSLQPLFNLRKLTCSVGPVHHSANVSAICCCSDTLVQELSSDVLLCTMRAVPLAGPAAVPFLMGPAAAPLTSPAAVPFLTGPAAASLTGPAALPFLMGPLHCT